MQPRQRRSSEGIEALAAIPAAIALQTAGSAPRSYILALALRTDGSPRKLALASLHLHVEALGVRRAMLSDLLNEKAALSPEMALRIEKAFGVSMEMMLRIQTD